MDQTKQYHIGLGPGEVGRYVILPGDPGRVPNIAAHLDNPRKVASNREYTTYNGEVDGTLVSVTSTGIGCPSAAIAVEELARVGADTFIRVGTAGSLVPDVKLGDVVISTGAVREEGTTLPYVPLEFPAVGDPEVVAALTQAARSLKVSHHVGFVHTKDTFYSEEPGLLPLGEEQKRRWETWRKARVLATSMETSAIFILSYLRGLRAGEVVAVIGETHADAPVIKKVGVEEAIQVAIEAIRTLAARD